EVVRAEQPQQLRAIAQVHLMEFGACRYQLAVTAREIVGHDHAVTIEQMQGHVAADVTRASGDQNFGFGRWHAISSAEPAGVGGDAGLMEQHQSSPPAAANCSRAASIWGSFTLQCRSGWRH